MVLHPALAFPSFVIPTAASTASATAAAGSSPTTSPGLLLLRPGPAPAPALGHLSLRHPPSPLPSPPSSPAHLYRLRRRPRHLRRHGLGGKGGPGGTAGRGTPKRRYTAVPLARCCPPLSVCYVRSPGHRPVHLTKGGSCLGPWWSRCLNSDVSHNPHLPYDTAPTPDPAHRRTHAPLLKKPPPPAGQNGLSPSVCPSLDSSSIAVLTRAPPP